MADVTRLLQNPVETTDIVQKYVLLLVKHVVLKKKSKVKKKKRKKKKVNAASIEPVTSLDKCRVTFYWVIKCTLSKVLHNLDII